jgi:hypothetical protein
MAAPAATTQQVATVRHNTSVLANCHMAKMQATALITRQSVMTTNASPFTIRAFM